MILGKKKQYRPLIRFRIRAKEEQSMITNVRIAETVAKELQKRREMLQHVVRLGRRPLRQGEGYDELKSVKALREMKAVDLLRVMRMKIS